MCGTGYATATITVNPDPVAGFITGPDSVCIGDTISLHDTATGGTWLSGSSAIATVDGSGHVTGLSADTMNVIYSVTTVCGTAIAAHRVKVNSTLRVGTITGSGHLCTGTPQVLTASISGPNWSSGNNALATVSSGGVVTGVSAGIDTIYHNFTNSCGTASAMYIDTIDGHLSAGSLGTGDTVCEGDTITLSVAIPGGAWSLTNPNASISGTGVVIGRSPGADTIIYSVHNACGSSTTSVPLIVRPSWACASGINNVPGVLQGCTIYPNPNQGTFILQISGVIDNEITASITNITGTVIKQFRLSPSAGSTDINTEVQLNVPAGIYFLKTSLNGQVYVYKIFIAN